jgi:hypothetical protein
MTSNVTTHSQPLEPARFQRDRGFGFQPNVSSNRPYSLETQQVSAYGDLTGAHLRRRGLKGRQITKHDFPGLKSWAKSYFPFGEEPSLLLLTPTRPIRITPLRPLPSLLFPGESPFSY